MAQSPAAQSPDALYADREHIPSAIRAAEAWTTQMRQDASAFEPAWKLARICYWLGAHAPDRARRGYLEQGIVAARQAIRLAPQRPEGHFWTAANMGALAEGYGLRVGVRYRKPIREELEIVLRMDPAFMDGSPDRALGRWYYEVPALLGGSNRRSEQHLRASLQYNQDSTISRYFLAELLVDEKRLPEARAELQRIIGGPVSTEWGPEDRDYKQQAAALLATLR